MKLLNRILLWVALVAPNTLLAADDWRSWPMGDRMKLSVGIYVASMDTDAAVSEVQGLAGTPVNFEDDLGLDSSDTALFASINWRIFRRHELNFNYYNLDRDAAYTTTEPIIFDGVVFPSATETDTVFDISMYEMSYSYSLIFDTTKNLYIGLGVSAQDLDFKIASAEVPELTADESFIAPLPVVNMGADFAITENWLIGAKLGYMDADIQISGDKFDATVLIGDAGLRWTPLSNVGLGLNYSLFHLDGEYTSDSTNADLDLDYAGPRLSLDIFF